MSVGNKMFKAGARSAVGGIRGMIARRRAAKDVMEQSAKDKRRAAGDLTLANKALSDIKAGKLEFEPESSTYKLLTPTFPANEIV